MLIFPNKSLVCVPSAFLLSIKVNYWTAGGERRGEEREEIAVTPLPRVWPGELVRRGLREKPCSRTREGRGG